MSRTFASWFTAAMLLATAATSASAHRATFTLLYAFDGNGGAGRPTAAPTPDGLGNLYGETSGLNNGVVYELTADGTFTVLRAFPGEDGAVPAGGLIRDDAGNLYGEAQTGGGSFCVVAGQGCGTVFKIASDGTFTVLYRFQGGTDGDLPMGGLIRDAAGNLYGTTEAGGGNTCNEVGCGIVFKIAPDGTETVLYRFAGGLDGLSPAGGVLMDKAGNLYGTTDGGGSANSGTVFKLTPKGKKTVLYAFDGDDGRGPFSPLVRDRQGNFYGTALAGGAGDWGVVYKLAKDGSETVLHAFSEADGVQPHGPLVLTASGDRLYGTTSGDGRLGGGTVFTVSTGGAFKTLYAFKHRRHGTGYMPLGGLSADADGTLYGTTEYGGSSADQGVVFRIAP
jgi:uncharacterized repeat protein (TIGR03803 family)